ncbi:uncharacterized protein [Ptychodera flava]|uniref:uncharacterized protein n=1 Tax=Ptychodera flava TaxID=63121 RepID=UPI00396A8139
MKGNVTWCFADVSAPAKSVYLHCQCLEKPPTPPTPITPIPTTPIPISSTQVSPTEITDSTDNTAIIIPVCVGSLVLVAIFIFVWWYCRRRRQRDPNGKNLLTVDGKLDAEKNGHDNPAYMKQPNGSTKEKSVNDGPQNGEKQNNACEVISEEGKQICMGMISNDTSQLGEGPEKPNVEGSTQSNKASISDGKVSSQSDKQHPEKINSESKEGTKQPRKDEPDYVVKENSQPINTAVESPNANTSSYVIPDIKQTPAKENAKESAADEDGDELVKPAEVEQADVIREASLITENESESSKGSTKRV